jgi:hypothetical protein
MEYAGDRQKDLALGLRPAKMFHNETKPGGQQLSQHIDNIG